MELTQHNLFEELIMAPKIDTSFPNEIFPNTWNLTTTPFDHHQTPDLHFPVTNPSLLELISPPEFNHPCPFGELQPFLEALTSPEYGSFCENYYPMAVQEESVTNVEINKQVMGFLDHNGINCFEEGISNWTEVENAPIDNVANMENIVNVGLCGEKKSKVKKVDGQPSKNLMAERRRRKRLNDRLSMLRSIVPKISKMDRTSILGDTIDYMKELLDKIHKLREEGIDDNINQINHFKEVKPNEMLVRNPPKFDVERRNQDTRIEVCCTTKPGLLLSTLGTMDALGLDIQQCVISCFNDFSLQASCYEVSEHRSLVSSEDVKQALFRNAGYGGRCL